MWDGRSTKHLNVLKSSVRLISEPPLVTKAAQRNRRVMRLIKRRPGVLNSHPSPLQRPAESVRAFPIVCCAGVLPPAGSGGLRKPQISTEKTFAEMLSAPRTDNMVAAQTIEGMWTPGLQGLNVVAITAKLSGQIRLFPGECHVLSLLESAQCLV